MHPMKRLTEKQSRHSLTTQIVVWVVGFVSVLFVTALYIMFHYARESIYQEAMEKARQTLRTTELRIDNTLNEVETATRSMHWTIEKPSLSSQVFIRNMASTTRCMLTATLMILRRSTSP